MATLVIDNIDDALHALLARQAAAHGCSVAKEALAILREHLSIEAPNDAPDLAGLSLAEVVRALFGPLGRLELPEIEREPLGEPPDLLGTGS